MELKEFVQKVINDIVEAVDSSSKTASRKVELADRPDKRTIEFDVAVQVEESGSTSGKAGIKVLSFIEGGADITKDKKKSSTHRIIFGVDVDKMTKEEKLEADRQYRQMSGNYTKELQDLDPYGH